MNNEISSREIYGTPIKYLSKARLLELLSQSEIISDFDPELIIEETIFSPTGEPITVGAYQLRVNKVVPIEGVPEDFNKVEILPQSGQNFLTTSTVDLRENLHLKAPIYYSRQIAEQLNLYAQTPTVFSKYGITKIPQAEYSQGLVPMGEVKPGFMGRIVLEMGNTSGSPVAIQNSDILGLLIFEETEDQFEPYQGNHQGQYVID